MFWEGHKIFWNLHQLFDWQYLHRTNNWWRLRKILWPSQNMWTLTNFPSNHCEFCHREMLEFAFKKGLLFLKWLSLSRINIPGVFSFGYSSTVTQYTALLLQNGLKSLLKLHTYSFFSCFCLHIHVIEHPNILYLSAKDQIKSEWIYEIVN